MSFRSLSTYKKHIKTSEHKTKLAKAKKECKICGNTEFQTVKEFHPYFKNCVKEELKAPKSPIICTSCYTLCEVQVDISDQRTQNEEKDKTIKLLREQNQKLTNTAKQLSQKLKEKVDDDTEKIRNEYEALNNEIRFKEFSIREHS